MTQKLSYCGELVKNHDTDRFLLSCFARPQHLEGLWAVLAFNHEIAKTREVVTETQLGHIRLQWWRDALRDIYEKDAVLQHEVLKPLAEAIKAHHLSRQYFDDLLYAREFDLEDVMPTHIDGTLRYIDATNAPLFKLLLEVQGQDPAMVAVEPVALSYGLAGLLRAVPFHAWQKRCYLPEELLKKHAVKKLYELKPEGDLPNVIKELAAHFVHGAGGDHPFLKRTQRLALIYLKQLKACGYDVFHPRMRLDPSFKAIRMAMPGIF